MTTLPAVSTWLLEGGLSVLLFVGLLPLLIAPFLAWVYRRYRYPALGPTVLAVTSGLYASALVSFTTFPLPQVPDDFCTERELVDYWQLRPGASLGDVADKAADVGIGQTLGSGVFLQVVMNVVFFVPLGFLLAYWARRSLSRTLLVGAVVSLLVETSQGTGLWGIYPCPYRLADVDDLITNTLGAGIGWGLGRVMTRVLPFRDPAPRTDLADPTVRRRFLAAGLDLLTVGLVSFTVDVVVEFAIAARGSTLEAESPVWTLIQVLVGALLLLGVPLIRKDRATPGQLTVLLALARDDALVPAGRGSVALRFALRWMPILAFGSIVLTVIVVSELITVALRKDRRSWVGVLSRSRDVTHDQLAVPQRPGGQPADQPVTSPSNQRA